MTEVGLKQVNRASLERLAGIAALNRWHEIQGMVEEEINARQDNQTWYP